MSSTTPEQKYLTLTPDVVGTITLDADYKVVEVINWDGLDGIYFTIVDQHGALDPAVLTDGILGLPATVSSVMVDCGGTAPSGATIVKFISESATIVSVKANHNV